MIKNNLKWIGGISLVFLLGIIFSYESLKGKIDQIFIAALGLLTFTSIFYSLIVSSGMKKVQILLEGLENKKQKLIDQIGNIKYKNAKAGELSKELRKIALKIEDLEDIQDDLNLNKWLFMSVSSYLLSIAFFLVLFEENKWIIFFQIVSFWIGLTTSAILATVWFIVNNTKIEE